jgi:hypothetical protein
MNRALAELNATPIGALNLATVPVPSVNPEDDCPASVLAVTANRFKRSPLTHVHQQQTDIVELTCIDCYLADVIGRRDIETCTA